MDNRSKKIKQIDKKIESLEQEIKILRGNDNSKCYRIMEEISKLQNEKNELLNNESLNERSNNKMSKNEIEMAICEAYKEMQPVENPVDVKLSIYEACEAGEITEAQKDALLSVYQESFLKSPVKKFVEKLEVIKKERPSEYDGPEDIKKFVDKHYDDIVKCANILEKEPEKLRKDDIAYVISAFPTFFGGYLLFAAGTSFVVGAGVGAGMLIGGLLLMSINIVHAVVSYARTSTDKKVTDDLIKIKSALAKADRAKLPDADKKKVEDMIRSIDDAETSVLARFKTVKESVDVKLSIYEACEAGEITEAEKDELIKLVNDKVANTALLNKIGTLDPDLKDAEKKAEKDMQDVEA